MPRDGAITFRDQVGKLDVLNVECDKCGPDQIAADCRRKQAMNLNDICGARCPDLPKVIRLGQQNRFRQCP